MKKIIISWILVMGIFILGKVTPFDGQVDIMDFFTGFIAGMIGAILGIWNKE